MIQSHIYARLQDTPVFDRPLEEFPPAHLLHRGNWLGVLDRQGEWIHVIGIYFKGWVKSVDVEERPPLNLHISWSPGQPIEYVSSVSST